MRIQYLRSKMKERIYCEFRGKPVLRKFIDNEKT